MSVQNERIAAAAIREAQLTAAVQQLTMENMRLLNLIPADEEVTEEPVEVVVEVEPEYVEAAAVEEEDANTDSE